MSLRVAWMLSVRSRSQKVRRKYDHIFEIFEHYSCRRRVCVAVVGGVVFAAS